MPAVSPVAPVSPEFEPLADVARRIARAIHDAEAVPAEERPRVLVFVAGGRRLCLPLRALREVVSPLPLSIVPRAPEALLGIMNLRGRVVLVVDLVKVLPPELAPRGGVTPSTGDAGRILLLEQGGREVGLKVEGVEGIAALASDEAAQAVPLLPESLLETIAALAS